jgi:hypothetical protein
MFGYKLKMKVEFKNIFFLHVWLQTQNESRIEEHFPTRFATSSK